MDANQRRIELKFVLSGEVGDRVRACVADHMPADRGAVDGYPVVSEYFDTPDWDSYRQRQAGVPNRRRLRLRIYGHSRQEAAPGAFLEIKQKIDRMTVKRRVALTLDALHRISSTCQPPDQPPASLEEDRALAEARQMLVELGVRPAVQTRYHRFAYDSGPEGPLRVTIDHEPCGRTASAPLQPDDPGIDRPLAGEGCAIMEVKAAGAVPVWLRRLAGEHGLVPRGFSKYVAALDLCRFGRYGPGRWSPGELHPAGSNHS